MKALSVRQPWAWLIVEGHKPLENRTWRTSHRGNLQIHAAKECPLEEYLAAVAFVRRFDPRLAARIPSWEKLELGGIMGMVCVVDVVTHSPSPWFTGPVAFVMENPYPLKFEPLAALPGIFEINRAGEAVALPRRRPVGTPGSLLFEQTHDNDE